MEQVEITFLIAVKTYFDICCCHVFKHFALCTCVAAQELMRFHED